MDTTWDYAPAPESAALANLRPAYRPLNAGARFARKALRPSA